MANPGTAHVRRRLKISTTVYLTVEQYDALRAISDRTKVGAAEYIRQGVDWIIARENSLTVVYGDRR